MPQKKYTSFGVALILSFKDANKIKRVVTGLKKSTIRWIFLFIV